MGSVFRIDRMLAIRALFFMTMTFYGLALVRNQTIASIFEIIKLPILIAMMIYLFYLKPTVRLTVASALSWGFLLVVIVSTLYNSSVDPALWQSVSVFVVIALYFQACHNHSNLSDIIGPVIYALSILVIVASIPFVVLPGGYIGGRFASAFINTNVASAYIALALVVLSYHVIFRGASIGIIALVAVGFYLLLLTKGRGSLVATCVPIALMLMCDWKQRSARVNILRIVASVGALWLAQSIEISTTTEANQHDLFSFRSFELGEREYIMASHYAAFWNSPIIGAGAVIDKTRLFARTSGESSYTDFLALSGGIGSILIAMIVVRSLWDTWFHSRDRLTFFTLITCLLLSASEGYFVSIASIISMTLWANLAISSEREQS